MNNAGQAAFESSVRGFGLGHRRLVFAGQQQLASWRADKCVHKGQRRGGRRGRIEQTLMGCQSQEFIDEVEWQTPGFPAFAQAGEHFR